MPERNLGNHCEVVLATPPPITNRTAEENLGLGYLAAVLRKEGSSVKIIDGWMEGLTPHQVAERILEDPPQLFLGFSCYRTNMERTMEIASLLKQSGLEPPLVVGGFGPTFHADEFLQAGFDIAVRGESEDTILELYQHFTKQQPSLDNILGISYKKEGTIIHNSARPIEPDLDRLPFPSRDTLALSLKRKTPVHILSARGCEGYCGFCSVVAFHRLSEGPHWRGRSIVNFVDELEQIAGGGVEDCKVIDDSLIEPPRDEEWCSKLAGEISSRGLKIRLRGSIRADRVTDGVIKELKKAGFFAFSCGFENGSETALKRMGKRANLEQNLKALQIFKKYDIYVQAGHILFDHGTTVKELEENYIFLNNHIWTISKGIFTEMYAAAGTPFSKRLENLELLESDPRGLGNDRYKVVDADAYKVYQALKMWQKSHTVLYDMAIDPLSAPKSLNKEQMDIFHPFCIGLRKLDLVFMRSVLDLVHRGGNEQAVLDFASEQIKATGPLYSQIEKGVVKAYQQTGLVYDADVNPFI